MDNLGDQSFIPTNLGRMDEEMIPPGREFCSVDVVWKFRERETTQLRSHPRHLRNPSPIEGRGSLVVKIKDCHVMSSSLLLLKTRCTFNLSRLKRPPVGCGR
ncbi:hypothetical protein TNCV_1156101 [Trichonephila clavipes]|nr:hypothetical protein TNCV_1156101 [Trichonephila clavipes]